MNSGTADGGGYIGQGVWGGGTELQALRASLSPNLHVFLNPEAVQTLFGDFYGGVITQAQLIKSVAVGDCFNQKPFWLSQTWSGEEGVGEGPEIPILNHVLSYPGKQRPPLERRHSPKSHLIHLTRDTLTALPTSVIPRVLGALCQDRGQRPKMYFLLLIQITRSR